MLLREKNITDEIKTFVSHFCIWYLVYGIILYTVDYKTSYHFTLTSKEIIDWCPRPQLTSRMGIRQHYGKKDHQHNIVLPVFLNAKLQLLEFTKGFKYQFTSAEVF